MFRIWGHYDGRFIPMTVPFPAEQLANELAVLPFQQGEFLIYEG